MSGEDQEYEVSNRNELEAETWCKCRDCQRKYLAVECVCCKEITESKEIIEDKKLGKMANVFIYMFLFFFSLFKDIFYLKKLHKTIIAHL